MAIWKGASVSNTVESAGRDPIDRRGEPGSGRPFLSIEQLEVTYQGSIIALQGVSIDCREGEIVAVIGTNGAGKTTLLRAISGFLPGDHARITDGEISLDGARVHGLSPHRATQLGIVLVPERELVFTTLTVTENLAVSSSKGDRRRFTLNDIFELFPPLATRREQRAGYLSGGERKMLGIARALLLGPRMMLIDELSFGLAPVVVEQLIEALRGIRSRHAVTMIVVEQNAGVALEIGEYVYVLESGSIVHDGAPADVVRHEDVREFYLGMAGEGVRSYAAAKSYRRVRRWSA